MISKRLFPGVTTVAADADNNSLAPHGFTVSPLGIF
jgi:hypothetical protein